MALLVFAILNVMCCYFCYFVGTQRDTTGRFVLLPGYLAVFLRV